MRAWTAAFAPPSQPWPRGKRACHFRSQASWYIMLHLHVLHATHTVVQMANQREPLLAPTGICKQVVGRAALSKHLCSNNHAHFEQCTKRAEDKDCRVCHPSASRSPWPYLFIVSSVCVLCSSAATVSADLSAAISSIAAETLAAARPARGRPAAAAAPPSAASDDAAKEDAGATDGAAEGEEAAEKAEEAAKPKRVEAPSTINLLMQVTSCHLESYASCFV